MQGIRGITLIAILFMSQAWADGGVINPWQDATTSTIAKRQHVDSEKFNVRVHSGRRLIADFGMLAAELAVGDDWVVTLPLPDGTQANYRLTYSPVMAAALAEKFPQIRTFTAEDIENSLNKGSVDLTEHGFHGMFKHNGQWVFIDPEQQNNTTTYVSYHRNGARPVSPRQADRVLKPAMAYSGAKQTAAPKQKSIYSSRPVLGETLRTYRLAVSASAEYTAYHGGTVSAGLAAIATTVNRLNEVYRRDLSVRFLLVANNDEIIYTNRFLDPFNNSDDDLDENPAVLNSVIGVNNYDIGHVVNTGGGGLAYLGGICEDENKAYGMTGISEPTGDVFYIDYVAHEIGHQLGANHTFNGTLSNCGGGNRNAATAWEPGSGSTIMGYAGICGAQNLQDNSDAFFHSGSIEEMLTEITSKTCGVKTGQSNTVPTVDAGSDYTIPANTPFKLLGSANDANGDALSYSWDEYDTGAAARNLQEMVDNGNRPLFRSWDMTNTAERYFPRLQDVLLEAGYTTVGESYPTTDRDLTFRFTARDGKGGLATDEMILTVKQSAGPFRVTEPTAASQWLKDDKPFIRWDVAGTADAPIACQNVTILLSTDGGRAFSQVLAASTPNDGEYQYTVGALESSAARVMIKCLGNVFFAVNEGGFGLGRASAGNQGNGAVTNKSGGGAVSLVYLLCFIFIQCVAIRFQQHLARLFHIGVSARVVKS